MRWALDGLVLTIALLATRWWFGPPSAVRAPQSVDRAPGHVDGASVPRDASDRCDAAVAALVASCAAAALTGPCAPATAWEDTDPRWRRPAFDAWIADRDARCPAFRAAPRRVDCAEFPCVVVFDARLADLQCADVPLTDEDGVRVGFHGGRVSVTWAPGTLVGPDRSRADVRIRSLQRQLP